MALRKNTLKIIQGPKKFDFCQVVLAIFDLYFQGGELVDPAQKFQRGFGLDRWSAVDMAIAQLGVTETPRKFHVALARQMLDVLGDYNGMGADRFAKEKIPKVVLTFIHPEFIHPDAKNRKRPFHKVALKLLEQDPQTVKALQTDRDPARPFICLAYLLSRCLLDGHDEKIAEALLEAAMATKDFRILQANATALITFPGGLEQVQQIYQAMAAGEHPCRRMFRSDVWELAKIIQDGGGKLIQEPDDVARALGITDTLPAA
ncbi:MAG: hypothetical protein NTZ18_04275 [Candidatus Komeilibacteria bacterium]|nr:hypothetical protein [Candidatus Komeilibacteria bacterium]